MKGKAMSQIHEGGCLCGAVRYRAHNEPLRRSVCHCRNCQRRTGSAFGIGAYFNESDVELSGTLRTYEQRSDESGRWLKMQFCPNCGSTVSWTLELYPGLRALAGGTFDDPDWLTIERHVWTRSRQKWVVCPQGVETFEKGSTQPPAKG
jgi:hypothetical protein